MFSATFIHRPRFAMVIAVFTVLAGAICALNLPISEYPQVSPPTIMVIAAYPGASAQVIADTVAAPLEAEVNGVEHLTYYSSQSDSTGSYTLTLTFDSGSDADMALVNVNNAVKRAERSLPGEVTANGVFTFTRSGDILGVAAVSSDNPEHTPLFLSNYVSMNILDAISRVDGVGQAIIFGAKDYSMRLWLDPLRMRALGVGYAELAAAVQRQNVQAATGSVGTNYASNYMQFKVETQGRLRTAEEFGAIVIRSLPGGRQIRVADVARVELGSENYDGGAALNGKPTIPLAIFMQNDANALQVMADVTAEIDRAAESFPQGMSWSFAYDTTQFVRVTMTEIVMTLAMTFVLVVLITYVFLQDWRATLIPGVAIPVSLIGTFLFLQLMGMTINTLTMFALVLAIASVVDDGIVVVESAMHLIQAEGLSPYEAAMKTMKLVTNALVATTLVVIAVYAPIGFFGGMVGTIYLQFAVTMCVALSLSTINALTLSPALCAIVLRPTRKAPAPFRLFNYGLDRTRRLYLGVSRFLIGVWPLAALVFAGILCANVWVFQGRPASFLPDEDKGVLFCEITLPAGATLSRTEAVLDEVVKIGLGVPGVGRVMSVAGMSLISGNGENMAVAFIDLKDWDERKTPETQIGVIRETLMGRLAALPDASVMVFAPPAIPGLGATGGVTFALQAVADQTPQEMMGAIQGLIGGLMQTGKVAYGFTSFDASSPMLRLDLDRAKAEAMGVPVSSVFNTLQTQLGSAYINDFNMYGKTFRVKMQSELDFRENINAIGQLYITSATGAQVPLDALATVGWSVGPRQVERFNMFPSAALNLAGMPGASSGEIMALVQEHVRALDGYQVSWTDMSFQESQNEGQVVTLVLMSVIFAYLFLVAQYESWTLPFSIILSVATATLGGLLALWAFDHPLDIYCQLGLLMLVGLTAKTAILMVEFSKLEHEDGASIVDAAIAGLQARFRAVMMTTVSFVIGVMPMVWATGAGSGSRRAIGITIFYGMIAATVVGIMFIPVLYVMFQRLAEWMMGYFGKALSSGLPATAVTSASARLAASRSSRRRSPLAETSVREFGEEEATEARRTSSRRFRGGIPGIDKNDGEK